ncbi:sensor histidine kinase [Terrilactibacillus laevilacticus]|uniref:histidine kinase n=1 Tax=Terrilactibacillus laevilacticus TaxID=1380157 RepID=A0ABW5PQS5_9BACI|nr:HAMP domain-containing sensor histidine kinase [Terrilactibacillus laevilacticus]
MKWTITLSQRIWISFAILIVLIGLIIAIVYPFYIQETLIDDTFYTIEQEQWNILHHQNPNNYSGNPELEGSENQPTTRTILNRVVLEDAEIPKNDSVLKTMMLQAKDQKRASKRYQLTLKGTTLFYVIRKIEVNTESGYLISYTWDTYTQRMMHKLWSRLLFIFILAGIFSLFIAAWLARYLKRPLNILGRRFDEIAHFNWQKPFEWKNNDEFGQLSAQFERMRVNLLRYDESQKHFLQQASHELKTPIMIIQSYAQSAKDGIYPQGDLDDTMDVIINEASQMEKRVRKLIYYAKVDSLREKAPVFTRVVFGDLANELKERFATQRPSVTIHVEGGQNEWYVDEEQWRILLENLLENALRYAKENVWLTTESTDLYTRLIVKNDGHPIPDDEMMNLFEPFRKGKQGQFGLGLSIVKRIVDRHSGTISIQNEQPNGVAFIVTISHK